MESEKEPDPMAASLSKQLEKAHTELDKAGVARANEAGTRLTVPGRIIFMHKQFAVELQILNERVNALTDRLEVVENNIRELTSAPDASSSSSET